MKKKEHHFQQIIRKLQELSGLDVDILLEDHFPGRRMIGGKYSLETNVVTIYLEEVRKQCFRLYGSDEKLLDYFSVILAHELGHAADQTLMELSMVRAGNSDQQKRKQLSIRMEENAWNYARRLVPELQNILNVVMERSLAMYEIERDK
ncbi:hypothetical protein [Pseudalkalibacillus hwajinpoensis]|uniref:ImmA/IrrE family metallo-endopeptidase n=1 Tax=Guptibacillus hwajinpoensis TaxID=208199 RepID=A0A4V5PZJ0_9BACL|nr:hypothetical protein [Pseudalkalibacillus hwajinpoensis]TKD70218.1 hypothetical protein FBF83_13320 [Pseudalkalibacillus hwajinpoensis]